jgi:LacI family transcriptional regulator
MFIIPQRELPCNSFFNTIVRKSERKLFIMKNQNVNGSIARTTIRHVALDAGVSVAAVSKVLRNAYGVSAHLRQKVEMSIEKLNYRPSVAARAMRGQTHTIGILVIELTNPFLPSVIDSASELLAQNGYKALVGLGHSVSMIEASMIEAMMDSRMDGVLLVAPHTSGKILEKLARQIPMVVIAHHEKQAANYDTVNSDDRLGARLAVECLLERGYRDIAMMTYDEVNAMQTEVVPQRVAGYLDAMRDAGLEKSARLLRLPMPGLDRSGIISQILKAPDRPRAVFVWSDLDAIPLLSACRAHGIRVPEDMAVIGYDNSPPAAIPLIGLSSIDQDPVTMARRAAELLLTRIEGRQKPEHILIPPSVVVRDTV